MEYRVQWEEILQERKSMQQKPAENKDKKETEQRANRCICPVCGAETMEIRGKAQCTRCHTICETCCEGGRQ
jgi:hypothetical protein